MRQLICQKNNKDSSKFNAAHKFKYYTIDTNGGREIKEVILIKSFLFHVSNIYKSGMDLIIDGWFHERGVLWPGQAMSLQVKEVLYHGRSKFQDVLVFVSLNISINQVLCKILCNISYSISI